MLIDKIVIRGVGLMGGKHELFLSPSVNVVTGPAREAFIEAILFVLSKKYLSERSVMHLKNQSERKECYVKLLLSSNTPVNIHNAVGNAFVVKRVLSPEKYNIVSILCDGENLGDQDIDAFHYDLLDAKALIPYEPPLEQDFNISGTNLRRLFIDTTHLEAAKGLVESFKDPTNQRRAERAAAVHRDMQKLMKGNEQLERNIIEVNSIRCAIDQINLQELERKYGGGEITASELRRINNENLTEQISHHSQRMQQTTIGMNNVCETLKNFDVGSMIPCVRNTGTPPIGPKPWYPIIAKANEFLAKHDEYKKSTSVLFEHKLNVFKFGLQKEIEMVNQTYDNVADRNKRWQDCLGDFTSVEGQQSASANRSAALVAQNERIVREGLVKLNEKFETSEAEMKKYKTQEKELVIRKYAQIEEFLPVVNTLQAALKANLFNTDSIFDIPTSNGIMIFCELLSHSDTDPKYKEDFVGQFIDFIDPEKCETQNGILDLIVFAIWDDLPMFIFKTEKIAQGFADIYKNYIGTKRFGEAVIQTDIKMGSLEGFARVRPLNLRNEPNLRKLDLLRDDSRYPELLQFQEKYIINMEQRERGFKGRSTLWLAKQCISKLNIRLFKPNNQQRVIQFMQCFTTNYVALRHQYIEARCNGNLEMKTIQQNLSIVRSDIKITEKKLLDTIFYDVKRLHINMSSLMEQVEIFHDLNFEIRKTEFFIGAFKEILEDEYVNFLQQPTCDEHFNGLESASMSFNIDVLKGICEGMLNLVRYEDVLENINAVPTERENIGADQSIPGIQEKHDDFVDINDIKERIELCEENDGCFDRDLVNECMQFDLEMLKTKFKDKSKFINPTKKYPILPDIAERNETLEEEITNHEALEREQEHGATMFGLFDDLMVKHTCEDLIQLIKDLYAQVSDHGEPILCIKRRLPGGAETIVTKDSTPDMIMMPMELLTDENTIFTIRFMDQREASAPASINDNIRLKVCVLYYFLLISFKSHKDMLLCNKILQGQEKSTIQAFLHTYLRMVNNGDGASGRQRKGNQIILATGDKCVDVPHWLIKCNYNADRKKVVIKTKEIREMHE